MGWGAAQVFYEENSSWLDSVEDAYDVLYGTPKQTTKRKNKCDICGKRLKNARGLQDHIRDKHGQQQSQESGNG